MGKQHNRKGVVLGKGLKKTDRKAISKLPKSARNLLQGALAGGAGGAWVNALVTSKKGPSKEEVQKMKQKSNHSGPSQTAHLFMTKPGLKTLLIGEGNFSFAKSLIEVLGGSGSNITATAFDDLKTVKSKYPDAKENLLYVKASGASILFDIDGTKLEENMALDKPYDLIIFNFPHVGLGIKDQELNVAANSDLVSKFLESASPLLSSTGLICVTLKQGDPYDLWRVPLLGLRVSTLKLKNTVPFQPDTFPGYAHRRTAGIVPDETGGSDNDIMVKGAHTYMFTPHVEKAETKRKKKGPQNLKSLKPGAFNPKGGKSRGWK